MFRQSGHKKMSENAGDFIVTYLFATSLSTNGSKLKQAMRRQCGTFWPIVAYFQIYKLTNLLAMAIKQRPVMKASYPAS
jgi:hypothetical protein